MIRNGIGSLLLLVALGACAQVAPSRRPPVTTHEDVQAIEQVTVDFRAALARKDVAALASLLLDERVLFASPPSPAAARIRQEKGNADPSGTGPGGFATFAAFVAGSSAMLEERFHDIRITQDGHLAWVSFDFEFLADGKVENDGIEAWQLLKTADGRWKIISVLWSSHGAPK